MTDELPEPITEAPPLEEREAFYERLDRIIDQNRTHKEVATAIALLTIKREVEIARQQRESRDRRRSFR